MPRVSFANDVSKQDGHAVTIEEQQSVDIIYQESKSNPFVGRTISVDGEENVDTDRNESERRGNSDIENVVVNMGILKWGYRYRVSVPIIANLKIDDIKKRMDQMNLDDDFDTTIVRMDDDLQGEINMDGTQMIVSLSARQRGPYLGRLLLEQRQKKDIASDLTIQYKSLKIQASIMGKGMGTPQLRNGVVCLGKIVGYDSDDETEWQGFDYREK